MTSFYITDRAAMQQAALDFADRYYEEIDIVALREACLDRQFLAEVVQSWPNELALETFMALCALEQDTPVV